MAETKLLDHLVKVKNKSGAIPPLPASLRELKASIDALPIGVGARAMSAIKDVERTVLGVVDMIESLGSLSQVGQFKNLLGRIAGELGTTDITGVDRDRLVSVVKSLITPQELEQAVGGAIALAAGLGAGRGSSGNQERDERESDYVAPDNPDTPVEQEPGIGEMIADLLALKGSTLYRGESELETLPVGANGQFMRVVNGVPGWDTLTYASESEAQAGVADNVLMSPLNVEQHMLANVLGWGQTWQDFTASRAYSTAYQNTTGRPILVAIATNNNNTGYSTYSFEVSADNSTWLAIHIGDTTNGSNQGVRGHLLVPNGMYYRLIRSGPNTAAIAWWRELR